MLFLFFAPLLLILEQGESFAQSPCPYPSSYYQRLTPGAYYSWYWNGDIQGAYFKNEECCTLTLEEAVALVRDAIRQAFLKWHYATDTRVIFHEVDSPEEGAIKIVFTRDLQDDGTYVYGFFNDATNELQIATDFSHLQGNNFWTGNPQLVPYPYFHPDIYSIFMHELTHVFLGVDHRNEYRSVMLWDATQVKRDFTVCDKEIIQNIYDPVRSITARNSFDGGLMHIDDELNNREVPLPDQGQMGVLDLPWREMTYPHTLQAVRDQVIPENGVNYKRLFNQWTRQGTYLSDEETVSADYHPTQILGYQANFLKEFNIPLVQATSVESGNNGTYRINGVSVGSSWENGTCTQYQSVGIKAVPSPGWYFISWTTGETTDSLFLTPTDHVPNFSARYKAHLGTANATLTDAHNQRRLVSSPTGKWLLVYESGGDVWATLSEDNGQTWSKEERLNVAQGQASAPTVSNVMNPASGVDRVVVSWVEHEGALYQVHVQTMLLQVCGTHLWYGWVNASGGGERSTDNHTTLANLYSFTTAKATSRPAILLDGSGYDAYLTWAVDLANGGMNFHKVNISNGFDQGSPLVFNRSVSSNTSDSDPVIVSYPSVYDYPSRLCLYYLGAGYASGRRVVQYDYATSQNTIVSGGYGDYTYYSLSGATNPPGGSFALVSDGVDGAGRRFVNYYQKPTYYGSSLPTLVTSYLDMKQPALMVEATGGFGMPSVEIDMVSAAAGGAFYKSTGGTTLTYVGSSVEGLLSREQVGSGSRALFVCRSDATPARLVFYGGTGPLGKSSGGTLGTDLQAVRTWKDRQGKEQLAVLDFSGANVSMVDSLESDATICAAEVAAPSVAGLLVRQPDSLAVPLAVRLMKAGRSALSYGESAWSALSTSSLPEFSSGDVLCLESLGGVSEKRGYTVVRLCPATELAKGGAGGGEEEMARGDALLEESSSGELVAYPNPFNPSTSLRFHLKSPGRVQLTIYDVLGRSIATVADGSFEAGYHSLWWNASGPSSGVYYARLSVQGETPATDATTVRRLLLMK